MLVYSISVIGGIFVLAINLLMAVIRTSCCVVDILVSITLSKMLLITDI